MYVSTQEMSCINEKYANQYYQKKQKSDFWFLSQVFARHEKQTTWNFDFIHYQGISAWSYEKINVVIIVLRFKILLHETF